MEIVKVLFFFNYVIDKTIAMVMVCGEQSKILTSHELNVREIRIVKISLI